MRWLKSKKLIEFNCDSKLHWNNSTDNSSVLAELHVVKPNFICDFFFFFFHFCLHFLGEKKKSFLKYHPTIVPFSISEHAQWGLGGLQIMIMVLLVLTIWVFNYGLNAKDSNVL